VLNISARRPRSFRKTAPQYRQGEASAGPSLDQGQPPQVATVQVKQIEGDQHDLARFTSQLVLQDGEIGRAVGGRHDNLAVDDRAAATNVPGVGGHLLEPGGPVVGAAGVDANLSVLQVHLNAVAIKFDLVNPAAAAGTFSMEEAKAGSMNPGKRLGADRGRFSTLERHAELHSLQLAYALVNGPVPPAYCSGRMPVTLSLHKCSLLNRSAGIEQNLIKPAGTAEPDQKTPKRIGPSSLAPGELGSPLFCRNKKRPQRHPAWSHSRCWASGTPNAPKDCLIYSRIIAWPMSGQRNSSRVDALHLADVDWESKDGRCQWVDVPDDAVLKGANGNTVDSPPEFREQLASCQRFRRKRKRESAMKLIDRFPELSPEKRPQDTDLDGSGLRFEPIEHGGDYPDRMPQAIKLTDAEGRACIYVPIS
jgi:hypothetical protein